ncbi:Thiamin pyrophosphokinase-related protein [Taphrina deformans PYCC 5710]|uniref:Thiamin pyrophosphokinase-related protein n=1 Tax=Taphrina deformans (strain PYCC 5710 / ATCC 11124 / CBS 356.35 / IMI 108563 / JCM 9778 / NBRC 8474) TaxID=1097556 RepID=R4XB82_TAPDE|nr:Thiamin pyrophosphokinase-related protein [Taphrina deformans PYCC 5710]|eukprot:CCG81597.1 Thiamin pyrophosphokinase-related protein [Taphrina deformans PYCC 5710]
MDRPDTDDPRSTDQGPSSAPKKTFLDLIDACDSFPRITPAGVPEAERLSRFYAKGHLVGYLRASVVSALKTDFPSYFDILPNEGSAFDVFVRDQEDKSVGALSKLLNGVAQFWHTRDTFEVLKGWRGEQYTIYGPERAILFTLERAACGLFGLVTYGAHMTAYIPATETSPIRVWCPRRSSTKATFPNMLDNSAAGGISNGLSAYETMVKEANEEASVPEDIARKLIRSVGAISYIYVDGTVDQGAGWIQPEVEYVYDLPLTAEASDLVLRPNDGEAVDFELWTIDKVSEEMLAGHFKPNCAAVMIDFMIRHGLLTYENEPDYLRILQRLHRTFEFPVQ